MNYYCLEYIINFVIIMHMKNIITITSKRYMAIQVAILHKLGLDKDELVISKPLIIDELSKKLSSYIKPGIKPLTDVDTFYQSNKQRYYGKA